ncbi:hypothetical protein L1987_41872 [Smallanthus sonchifolius]|uniref:Uncharacterized protein n=1 Tax=Smallanthus sonchifolius TaxID=185202 RepID=A0ACB9GVD5_9ASTR|nr:hypothetical protein L1987_41872 [Smallanthus sonchifolius]
MYDVLALAKANHEPVTTSTANQSTEKRITRTSAAYEIAASAATYVQSQAGRLINLESEPRPEEDDYIILDKADSSQRVYNSEMAAYMAATTMTAVVAAPEKEKQEAARDLQSLHSSPCEWFICDDSRNRNVVKPSVVRPVVTFGSPFVFCNGQKILDQLGLDENHVHCVMMHRDIVPRAFSCNYPNHVAQLLKRLCGTFRSHPCLNRNSLLYTPLGKMFIIQPDEKSSPHHPLLPPGSALYVMENTNRGSTKTALRAFLNSPHPIETLQHPSAYGSDGTILKDHDSSNYLKAVNGIIRQHTKTIIKKPREQRNLLWPLLTSQSPHYWSQETKQETKLTVSDQKRLITTEVA